jgi:hypothetical protein
MMQSKISPCKARELEFIVYQRLLHEYLDAAQSNARKLMCSQCRVHLSGIKCTGFCPTALDFIQQQLYCAALAKAEEN